MTEEPDLVSARGISRAPDGPIRCAIGEAPKVYYYEEGRLPAGEAPSPVIEVAGLSVHADFIPEIVRHIDATDDEGRPTAWTIKVQALPLEILP